MLHEDEELPLGAVVRTRTVPLTQDRSFVLHLVFELDKKGKKFLLFVVLAYKNLYFSENYQEVKYLCESIGLFGQRYYSDLDSDEFEVVQKKQENGKILHTFFCKFIKDEKVYLNRGMCRTIHASFIDALQGYSKTKLLEEKTHDEMHLFFKQMSDFAPLNKRAMEEMDAMEKSILPEPVKRAIFKRFVEEGNKKKQ